MFECTVTQGLRILKGKWRVSILFLLENGPKRYNILKSESKGITNTMLNRSLKELEKFGYISRNDYSDTILHVEYSLTEKGIETVNTLNKLNDINLLFD